MFDKQNNYIVKKNILKNICEWSSLGLFILSSLIILIESGMDGESSGEQSGAITGQVQDAIDKNYDKESFKAIKDFDLTFSKPIERKTFYVGDSLTYLTSYTPEDTSYKSLAFEVLENEYSSKDVLIIKEESSSIFFKKKGNATLEVTSKKNNKLKKTYSFKVEDVLPTKIELLKENKEPLTNITLAVGDTYLINPTFSPVNATNKELTYKVGEDNIIEVNSLGLIKANNIGTTLLNICSSINETISTQLEVTVKPIIDISMPISSLKIDKDLGYLNENVLSKKVVGKYQNTLANFDIKKLHFLFNRNETYSLLDIKDLKRTSLGEFSFEISLSSEAKRKLEEGSLTSEEIKLSIYYEDMNNAAINSVIAIKSAKSLTILDIDQTNIPSSISPRGVTFKKIDNQIYYEPIVLNYHLLDKTNEQNLFKKDNFKLNVIAKDGTTNLNSSFNIIGDAFSFSLYPLTTSTPILEGTIKYYPNKDSDEYLSTDFKYLSLIDNKATFKGIELPLNKDIETNFLVGMPYKNSDLLGGLFKGNILLNEEDESLKNIFNNAAINEEIINNDNVAQATKKDNQIESLTFLKTGTITLNLQFLNQVQQYFLKGVATPNSYETYLDGKLLNDDLINISKGEKKIIEERAYLDTPLNNGEKLRKEANITYNYSLKEEDKSYLTYKYDENTSFHYLVGNITSLTPIELNLTTNYLGTSNSFTKKVTVSYIAVKENDFSLNIRKISSPNEYNEPSKDCSIVPLGSLLLAETTFINSPSNQRVTYSSSNSEVLNVDSLSGEIKALKVGEASIEAISNDNPSIKKAFKIKVVDTVSPFLLDLDLFKPNTYKEMYRDGKFTGFYVWLNYGTSYRFAYKTSMPSTSSSFTYLINSIEGEKVKEAVSIDKIGNIETLAVGRNEVFVDYTEGLETYSLKVVIEIIRNYKVSQNQIAMLIRKGLGHFSLFAVTAVFALIFIFLAFDTPLTRLVALAISEIIGFSLAGFSELIQLYTPGRGCSFFDVGIDTAGFSLVVIIGLIILFIPWITKIIKDKKIKKLEKKSK